MGTPLLIHAQMHTHHMLDMIAIIGTSDRPCWLAEACKIHALEGLWIHGVTVPNAPLTVITVHGCVNMPGHVTDGLHAAQRSESYSVGIGGSSGAARRLAISGMSCSCLSCSRPILASSGARPVCHTSCSLQSYRHLQLGMGTFPV